MNVINAVADVMDSIKEAGVTEGCDRVIGNLMYGY